MKEIKQVSFRRIKMIIVSATLNFESKEQRDRAIEITADIQLATREEEEADKKEADEKF